MGYGTGTYGSESFGGSAGQIAHSTFFTLDARIGTFTLFTIDARLIKTQIKTYTLNAVLLKTVSLSFSFDSILVFRRTVAFDLASYLQKKFPKTFNLAAIILKAGTKNFTISSILIFRREITFSLDVSLKKTFSKIFTIGTLCYIRPVWLNPWKYRKTATICGGTNTTAPGYMQITVHKGTGTTSGADIFLNGQCNDDFSDIRFTKQDGTSLLPHTLVSSVNGDNAIFLVKIDYIPASPLDTSIYIYYQNGSATSVAVSFATLGLTAFETSHLTCKYLPDTLQTNWQDISFDDSSWLDGVTPFHSTDSGGVLCPGRIIYNDTTFTDFEQQIIFIRKTFYAVNAISNINITHGIDNDSELFLNGISLGTASNTDCAAITDHTVISDISQGFNIVAWKIYGALLPSAFDFIFNSVAGLFNVKFSDATICDWGNQQQQASGRNIMRTHRVGIRIING